MLLLNKLFSFPHAFCNVCRLQVRPTEHVREDAAEHPGTEHRERDGLGRVDAAASRLPERARQGGRVPATERRRLTQVIARREFTGSCLIVSGVGMVEHFLTPCCDCYFRKNKMFQTNPVSHSRLKYIKLILGFAPRTVDLEKSDTNSKIGVMYFAHQSMASSGKLNWPSFLTFTPQMLICQVFFFFFFFFFVVVWIKTQFLWSIGLVFG